MTNQPTVSPLLPRLIPVSDGWRARLAEEIAQMLYSAGVTDVAALPTAVKILSMVQSAVDSEPVPGRYTFTGVVDRIHRQPASRYSPAGPTLIYVDAVPMGGLLRFDAPADCEDVTGRTVTITVDVADVVKTEKQ